MYEYKAFLVDERNQHQGSDVLRIGRGRAKIVVNFIIILCANKKHCAIGCFQTQVSNILSHCQLDNLISNEIRDQCFRGTHVDVHLRIMIFTMLMHFNGISPSRIKLNLCVQVSLQIK